MVLKGRIEVGLGRFTHCDPFDALSFLLFNEINTNISIKKNYLNFK